MPIINSSLFGSGGTDTSNATATAADILTGKTAYIATGEVIGTMPTQGAQTITPGTSAKTIAAGRYLTGTQTIQGDAHLVASNIKQGVSIFGVAGSLTARPQFPLWTITIQNNTSYDFAVYYLSAGSTSGSYGTSILPLDVRIKASQSTTLNNVAGADNDFIKKSGASFYMTESETRSFSVIGSVYTQESGSAGYSEGRFTGSGTVTIT
ncbi:hypothetical protein [Flavonifractor plautii]|jgi:hypothetical protein|uniref:hypothetical protein n=1 Tax=Flavonifractor plautii TaxID=292800 RepID=UPI001D01FE7F|nr:hypothetical protein [Flavonifractor plautii]MCB5584260.1 hypothetical protein [Flavonifractor plautii]DAD66949.1 MAG TPA: tail protein [Bacteriophage sp.]